jgi:hypothetical protein
MDVGIHQGRQDGPIAVVHHRPGKPALEIPDLAHRGNSALSHSHDPIIQDRTCAGDHPAGPM